MNEVGLARGGGRAMVAAQRLTLRVRAALVAVAAGLAVVFAVAVLLDPYDAAGVPLTMATHRQLGLPPCSFLAMTGYPCPTCGMTTSFALLVRGDVAHSARANFVGTLMAMASLIVMPWALVSAAWGRWLGVRRVEPWLYGGVFALAVLALLRWAVVLVLTRYG